MYKYFVRRLLLFIPTLIGITFICFFIIHLAPGGPIERKIVELRFGGGTLNIAASSSSKRYNVSQEVVDFFKEKIWIR